MYVEHYLDGDKIVFSIHRGGQFISNEKGIFKFKPPEMRFGFNLG